MASSEERQALTEALWERLFPPGTLAADLHFAEPMARHTTLGLGGPADVIVAPADALSLQRIVQTARAEDYGLQTLGAGSNLVVGEGGIRGITLSFARLNRLQIIEKTSEGARVFVEAGVPLGRLVRFAAEEGLAGLENLAGIPGGTGGAVRMNAGSFGTAFCDVVDSIMVMDRIRGNIGALPAGQIPFVYRDWGLGDEPIILSAQIRLRADDAVEVLKRTSGVQREKQARQPINQRSAGCVFRNPPDGPPAWTLIDAAGFRGRRRGGIQVSEKHANFFVNTGGGTASDFLGLMRDVRDAVEKTAGIRLEPEVRTVGERE